MLQPGARQTPPLQTLLAQSGFVRQPSPSPQGRHRPPPQSTSVSEPFDTPSAHVGAWHTFVVHTSLTQSLPLTHDSPEEHLADTERAGRGLTRRSEGTFAPVHDQWRTSRLGATTLRGNQT